MRPVVVHFHLFKNAGTSVEDLLRQNLGDRWRSWDGDTPGSLLGPLAMRDQIIAHPDVTAWSSHQVRPPLLGIDGVELLPVVFLRDPIARIWSAYRFERNQGGVSPSSRAAQSSSFADWIEFHRGRGSHQVANFQVMSLSLLRDHETGRPTPGVSAAEHAESAMAWLETVPVVGLVERFEESVEQMAAWLGPPLGGFETATVHANAGEGGSDLDRIRDELGADAFDRLLAENRSDIALWSRTSRRNL